MDLTILMPCLNEAETLATCMAWAAVLGFIHLPTPSALILSVAALQMRIEA